MYHNSTTSSYKYVILDLHHLNKKKKSSRQALLQSTDYNPYGPEFNIQNSWVHGGGKGDLLKDSMLAYTKRMNDIRRIRGINALKNSNQSATTPALWINTGKGSLQFDMIEDQGRSKFYSSHNKLTKSLGNIKLEPLLGSRKISSNIDTDTSYSLQTHKVEKDTRMSSIQQHGEVQVAVKVKHITVTINIPPPEIQDEEEEEGEEPNTSTAHVDTPLSVSAIMAVATAQEPIKKKLVPLGGGRARPRKAKRMKIVEPTLESIDEDTDEAQVHTRVMEDGYNDLLNEVHNSHELMLEQKRKTVALLRQTNYAQRSHHQNRQMAMATLAKRKLKKLPPIPTGRPPMLRYTNSRGGSSSSPYGEDREDLSHTEE